MLEVVAHLFHFFCDSVDPGFVPDLLGIVPRSLHQADDVLHEDDFGLHCLDDIRSPCPGLSCRTCACGDARAGFGCVLSRQSLAAETTYEEVDVQALCWHRVAVDGDWRWPLCEVAQLVEEEGRLLVALDPLQLRGVVLHGEDVVKVRSLPEPMLHRGKQMLQSSDDDIRARA